MNYNNLNVSQLRENCRFRNIQECQGSNYITRQQLLELLHYDDLNSGITTFTVDPIVDYVIDPQYLITDDIQKCINVSNLLGTGFEELYRLDPSQILINEEKYCFSAQELPQILENSNVNPFTGVPFTPNFLRAAKKLISDNGTQI